MLISTNSSRRLRCRNILVEKYDNKVHLHYLKKKKVKWDFSIVRRFALKHVEEKSVKNKREIFYTVRDMLKK